MDIEEIWGFQPDLILFRYACPWRSSKNSQFEEWLSSLRSSSSSSTHNWPRPENHSQQTPHQCPLSLRRGTWQLAHAEAWVLPNSPYSHGTRQSLQCHTINIPSGSPSTHWYFTEHLVIFSDSCLYGYLIPQKFEGCSCTADSWEDTL